MNKFRINTIALIALVSVGLLSIALIEPANALPVGGRVINGSIFIASRANNVTIWQATNKGVIDWDSFSVGVGETVTFNLRKNAAILNRVIGNAQTKIDGRIVTNGHVYLVNANGVVVSATAKVDNTTFTHTNKDIDPSYFLSKDFVYQTDIQVPAQEIVPYGANHRQDLGVIGNLFSQN
ncbi:MAG: filamentous hemagglutinin N-terminal domain-containing protein [Alphaproteobacteria bacterium]|nr:filamentous hemagglutinin N-terminal domain-containing protein [Alphaproteobacteria bacterium]